MSVPPTEPTELENWRKVHATLAEAVHNAEQSVAKYEAQKRFWLEEIVFLSSKRKQKDVTVATALASLENPPPAQWTPPPQPAPPSSSTAAANLQMMVRFHDDDASTPFFSFGVIVLHTCTGCRGIFGSTSGLQSLHVSTVLPTTTTTIETVFIYSGCCGTKGS